MKTTSFAQLFTRDNIREIEIPIIQRDFAQGRKSHEVSRIRADFLNVLHDALTGGKPVNLDFVYGKVEGGTLIPLDGQQRLTTLFLLHWYLAARACISDEIVRRLPVLTYETRSSSRMFCQRIVEQLMQLQAEGLATQPPSKWIRDQSWFFAAWRHDPTIAAMLVVLDDIHERFHDTDCSAAWERLIGTETSMISFHFLPIDELGLSDDLYIKMNSRGKPLTKFERFKAGFEETVRAVSQQRYDEFIHKIDNRWSDVLWEYRGDDNLIDDEFMRYFRYVTDMLGHRTDVALVGDDGERAALIYGAANQQPERNLEFLFSVLDCWHGKQVANWFDGIFVASGHEPGKVSLFDHVDLFAACCKDYGSRKFTLHRALILFAALVHLRTGSDRFPERIRTLRNLVLNSEFEIRQHRMPRLLEDTHKFVLQGNLADLADLAGFNRRQIDEEARKARFITENPTMLEPLRRLEDHRLLRGCLAAFELDPKCFERRAATFAEIFTVGNGVTLPEVSTALLACGDYSQRNRMGRYQFGTPGGGEEIWRQLVTNEASADFSKTKAALQRLLDEVGTSEVGPIHARLRSVGDRFLDERKKVGELDWRYYLVKYFEMREGDSGLYASGTGTMGFNLCMLRKERMNSWYRDPYLYAVLKRSGAVPGRDVEDPWFTGYEHAERWMRLVQSGVQIRCIEEGFILKEPPGERYRSAFGGVKAKYSVQTDLIVKILHATRESTRYDTQDRVELGVQLLRDLLAMKVT